MTDPVNPQLPSSLFLEDRRFSPPQCPSIRLAADCPMIDAGAPRSSVIPQNEEDLRSVEQLAKLKQSLRISEEPDVFWNLLVEGLACICGAQFVFVVREEGEGSQRHHHRPSCLVGLYFYYNDGCQCVGLERNRLFFGANPLSHADYQRLCLITEGLGQITESGAGELPFAAEAYLSIPLFSRGECLAHLGLMWSDRGLQERTLSWLSLQMALYSLEDLVVQRLLQEVDGGEPSHSHDISSTNVIPSADLDVPHPIHPFKPYARSLSHELRTPMQGIVGMLDVMHATVREAINRPTLDQTNGVFDSLTENIEMIQGAYAL